MQVGIFCKYCGSHTTYADCVCPTCGLKLELVRKILKIGKMIKHGAEMEKALRCLKDGEK